jgi:hypothetical protein
MDILDVVMKWIIAPVAAFVWLMHQKVQEHHTDLQVLKSQLDTVKDAAERDRADMKATTGAILKKLDDIEAFLRTSPKRD